MAVTNHDRVCFRILPRAGGREREIIRIGRGECFRCIELDPVPSCRSSLSRILRKDFCGPVSSVGQTRCGYSAGSGQLTATMPSTTAMNVLTPQEKEFLRQINTPVALSAKPNTLFEKHDIVGKGAYGAVYKGKHRQTNQIVALKIINLDTADDDVEDIQKEVALLKRLMAQGSLANDENGSKQKSRAGDEEVYGVPNVIKYYGCWTEGPKVWIVMELADGGSVRTLVSEVSSSCGLPYSSCHGRLALHQ